MARLSSALQGEAPRAALAERRPRGVGVARLDAPRTGLPKPLDGWSEQKTMHSPCRHAEPRGQDRRREPRARQERGSSRREGLPRREAQ